MRSVPQHEPKAAGITGEIMRFSVVLVLLLVGLVLSVGVASAADPYGNDRYKLINVNSSIDGALSDFQVGNDSEPFLIEYDSDMQPDFDDIRMYYASNMTEIPHFLVNVVNSTNASGRMKLDVPAYGGVDVKMYYGNLSLSSGGNGSATFPQWHGSATDSFVDSQILSIPFVYEAKVRRIGSAEIYFGVSNQQTPYTDDSACLVVNSGDDKVYSYSRNEGAYSYDSSSPVWSDNTWTNIKIELRASDDIEYFYGDGTSNIITTNNPDESLGLVMYELSGSGENDFSFGREYTANPPIITIGTEQLDVSIPDINATLSTPINNTYTQHNNFTFSIAGNFSSANATLFIDSIPLWNGSITTGLNTALNITLTEGLHSWYINATATIGANTTYNQSSNESFYYDISNPTVPTVQINPDYTIISDGTIVKINLSWADNLQLKNGTFYIDTGGGYSEDSNTTLSGVSDWFNTSINTSGMVGNVITWKQEVYDQAGNNFTYSDSFYVALPSLLIYVYDETTGLQILPSDVTVYNEDVSRSATINGSTNISTLDYGNFTTGKYIVRVQAEGYYTRRSIALIDIETVSSLNVYLPDLNETVIFDQFILTDNTLLYNLSDCILKLSKPLPNGTDVVFSSYFDFDGVTSTYLIATDQYILYIETPDSVISYGWLTPDADGQIEIVITDPIEDLLDDWLSYSLTKSDAGSISLSYESDVEISTTSFFVNTTGGSVAYSASIVADSGSFTYAADVNESYWVSFTALNVDGDLKTVTRLIYWNEDGPQPERLPLLPEGAPDWFYNLLSAGVVIIVILLFSQIRADAACILGAAFSGMFWYWGWLKVSGIVIAVAALIAVAAIMYKSRREGI